MGEFIELLWRGIGQASGKHSTLRWILNVASSPSRVWDANRFLLTSIVLNTSYFEKVL